MAKPFTLPVLEEGQTLLTYILHPEKLEGYLKELATYQAGLDARITALGSLETAEALQSEAAAERRAASEWGRQAKAILAEATAEAIRVTEDSLGRREAAEADLEARWAQIREATLRLAERESDCTLREATLVSRERAEEELARRLVAREAAIQVAQDELTAKLARLKTAMA